MGAVLFGNECLKHLRENFYIPSDEIWIKIEGDHGDGTFKMSFQVRNIEIPDSRSNTIVFCLFQAKGYYENMQLSLSHFIPRMVPLQSMQ